MFRERRRRFLEAMQDGDLALFAGAAPLLRNHDVEYPFRQHSDFLYLTGCREPDALLLLARGLEGLPEETLFLPPREPEREIWTGRRLGPEGARERLGFADAAPSGAAEERLGAALARARRLWYRLGECPRWDRWLLRQLPALRRRIRQGVEPPGALLDPSRQLAEMRLLKSPEELERLRRSAAITAEGHLLCMAAAAPGVGEWELQALLEYCFRRRGADGWAYPPIVAGGANGCILHYTAAAERLRGGELLLVDAAAEVEGYAADVTRCYPVSGRFAPEQRRVYEIVLAAEKAGLAAVAPGAPCSAPHEAALRVLCAGLRELGVLAAPVDEILATRAYRPWFMHGTSHWLGLDVHDPGRYVVDGSSRPLQPGMCLTVEPGLYFRPGDERVPEPLRGLAVRVEDDVAVTGSGCEVLTAAVPKEIADLEQACAQARPLPPTLDAEPAAP